MEIIDIRAIEGPNIYSSKPVVKMQIDVKELENVATRDIPGFNSALLSYLPGLAEHRCCFDRPGGFLIRLEEGTYFPHVLEHVAIELLNMAGQDVSFGKARRLKGSVYNVIFGYEEKTSALKAAFMAVKLLESIIDKNSVNINEWISELRQMTIDGSLGPSTLLMSMEPAA